MKPLAIRGTYADWRLVKTRGVVQIVIEVPLSDSGAAFDVMGGMPSPANERWFGIAPLKKEVMPDIQSPIISDARPEPRQDKPARAKRDWRDIPPAEQAFLRCQNARFVSFLIEEWPIEWRQSGTVDPAADCVRLICGVESRADLNTNQKARVIWHQLNDQYEAWMRVGA